MAEGDQRAQLIWVVVHENASQVPDHFTTAAKKHRGHERPSLVLASQERMAKQRQAEDSCKSYTCSHIRCITQRRSTSWASRANFLASDIGHVEIEMLQENWIMWMTRVICDETTWLCKILM